MSDSLALVATHVLVPALFALWMGRSQHRSRFEWGLELLAFGTYTGFVFFTGRWGLLSIYLRYLAPLLLVIAAARSGRRLRNLPAFTALRRGEVVRVCLLALILCLTLPLLVITLLSLPAPSQSLDVDFPLRQDGLFYVAEGGPHVLLNRRADKLETRYATRIQSLDRFGRARAPSGEASNRSSSDYSTGTGTEPTEAGRLEIYSPVEGVIEKWSRSKTAAGAWDLTVLRPDGIRMVLGGMERSLEVGVPVARGDVVGTVPRSRLAGDSGFWLYAFRADSTEHVGVPLRFAGTYLMRNYLYRSLPVRE